jgi:hypothetical protein
VGTRNFCPFFLGPERQFKSGQLDVSGCEFAPAICRWRSSLVDDVHGKAEEIYILEARRKNSNFGSWYEVMMVAYRKGMRQDRSRCAIAVHMNIDTSLPRSHRATTYNDLRLEHCKAFRRAGPFPVSH